MHTEVSGVYVVNSAGIGHISQQLIEGLQAAGLHHQSALTITCHCFHNRKERSFKMAMPYTTATLDGSNSKANQCNGNPHVQWR